MLLWDVLLRLLLQVLELNLLDLCTTNKDRNAYGTTAGVLRCLTLRPSVVQQSERAPAEL